MDAASFSPKSGARKMGSAPGARWGWDLCRGISPWKSRPSSNCTVAVSDPWFAVANEGEIASPALLIFPERIEANIRLMVGIAGDPQRLWPHVKTHKLGPVVSAQIRHGITKFKCATIAEAE